MRFQLASFPFCRWNLNVSEGSTGDGINDSVLKFAGVLLGERLPRAARRRGGCCGGGGRQHEGSGGGRGGLGGEVQGGEVQGGEGALGDSLLQITVSL